MTKLILSDLDRTLLTTDKKITERTVKTLKKCQEKGILVGFSTSRGLVRIRDFMEQVNPDVVICNDGGVILYKGELVQQVVFDPSETQALLHKAYEVCGENVGITLDTLDKIFYNRKDPESDNYLIGADYSDFKNFHIPAIKICVKTDDSSLAKKISEAAQAVDCVKFSDIPWHKLSPENATKEKAVDFINRTYNISPDEMIAFGDDYNDMGMLKKCGTGVAMANAIDEIKEIADEITLSNDEDGVAVYLEKKVLA